VLLNIYGLDGAYLPAAVTFDTFILLDFVFFMGNEPDGFCRTILGTKGTSDTFVIDGVCDQVLAPSGGTPSIQVCLVFLPEITQGSQYRIGGCPAQTTQAALFGQSRQLLKFFQIP
jgi:hypothetical protein